MDILGSLFRRLSSCLSLQIGRFYEFRIAALNGNGTRGYSDTATFQLNESKSFNYKNLISLKYCIQNKMNIETFNRTENIGDTSKLNDRNDTTPYAK